MRLKCYTILDGLERSLGENLTRNFDTTKLEFYTDEELQRALKRMREDVGEQTLEIGDVYIEGKQNPVANYDCTIRLINNGMDNNSVLGWCNASEVEITQGRNNNEIIGLDVYCDNNIKYTNPSEETIFNIYPLY